MLLTVPVSSIFSGRLFEFRVFSIGYLKTHRTGVLKRYEQRIPLFNDPYLFSLKDLRHLERVDLL